MSRGPSPEESVPTVAFALAERCFPPRPPAATRVATPALAWAGGAAVVPGAHPQPPPSEVCLPPLPGWGKCASGRLVAEAVTLRLVPARPGQVVEGMFNGVLEQPGNPAFCNAGLDWRHLPSNMEPARERKRACKPELKYRGGIVWKP